MQTWVRGRYLDVWQLRQIRRSVPTTTLQTLAVTLVLSRLDYSISVLVGIPSYLVHRLQSVLNATAWLVNRLKRSDHVTDVLSSVSIGCECQNGATDVQSLTWKRTAIPWTFRPSMLPICVVPRAPVACRHSNYLQSVRLWSGIWNELPEDV